MLRVFDEGDEFPVEFPIPTNERTPAPEFAVKDSSTRTITLKNYRSKAVLLDF